MNVKIETYRGVEINFDTENERFSYHFDTGNWNEKQSYASCKKSIDDYFKENAQFKPFAVRNISSGSVKTIIGIRKDNRLIYDYNGQKEQLSEYDECNYILFDEKHDKIYTKIEMEQKKISDIESVISSLRKEITGTNLKDYKKDFILKQ